MSRITYCLSVVVQFLYKYSTQQTTQAIFALWADIRKWLSYLLDQLEKPIRLQESVLDPVVSIFWVLRKHDIGLPADDVIIKFLAQLWLTKAFFRCQTARATQCIRWELGSSNNKETILDALLEVSGNAATIAETAHKLLSQSPTPCVRCCSDLELCYKSGPSFYAVFLHEPRFESAVDKKDLMFKALKLAGKFLKDGQRSEELHTMATGAIYVISSLLAPVRLTDYAVSHKLLKIIARASSYSSDSDMKTTY